MPYMLRGAGRMYVFEHYVCFHSNVFGYVKNKSIPLKVTFDDIPGCCVM